MFVVGMCTYIEILHNVEILNENCNEMYNKY